MLSCRQLESGIVGASTPQELTNTTNQSLLFFFFFQGASCETSPWRPLTLPVIIHPPPSSSSRWWWFCWWDSKKSVLSFWDKYWIVQSWNIMMSEICFKILNNLLQSKGQGCKWNQFSHILIKLQLGVAHMVCTTILSALVYVLKIP